MTRWADVPGYGGKYQVSDDGQVRSFARSETPYVMKQRLRKGYPAVTFGDDKDFDVHCLVALAFIGPRPEGMFVCHADDDPLNCTVENLRYDTPRENVYDKIRNARRRSASSQQVVT